MAFYSAFQFNAFWSRAFQIARNGISPEPTPSTGGVDDYRAYRKKLRRIAEAADKRLYGKVQKNVAKLVASPAPDVVVTAAKEIERTIDFAALSKGESLLMAQQLDKLLIKLDQLIAEAIMRDEDEDLILMMALS
jgi:hypothetical protein